MTSETRISLACEECHRRKRRCDGARPHCLSCIKQGKECVYADKRDSRKRKRNKEYVGRLEEQVQQLSASLRALQPNSEEIFQENHQETYRTVSSLPASSEAVSYRTDHPPDSETRLASAVDEIGSITWKLKFGTKGDTSFIGPSNNFHLSSSIWDADGSNGRRSLDAPDGSRAALFEQYRQDICLQQELVTIFSDHLNKQHFFVDPTTLETVTHYLDLKIASPASLLRGAILAAAACLAQRPDAYNIGIAFSFYAESIVQHCCRSHPCVAVLQALTILCWRDLTLDNEHMAWTYNCMASGLATHLGLHVMALQNLNGVPLEDRKARIQAFWQCFRVDRIATFSLGRQCVLPWRRVRTPHLETALDDDSMSLPQLAFDYECRLLFIFDKFMEQIYSFEFYELDAKTRTKLLLDGREQLLSFYQDIDTRLATPGRSGCINVIIFHMFCHMSLLLVQRPLLRQEPNGDLYRLALRSMSTSAVSITNLIREYRKAGDLTVAPFFLVHHVLTAAIIHLLGATSRDNTVRRRSVFRFRSCVEAIEEMVSTQARSSKAIALLRELANRWKVVFALPIKLSYPFQGPNLHDQTKPARSFSESPAELAATSTELGYSDKDRELFSVEEPPMPLWTMDLGYGLENLDPDNWGAGDPFEGTGLNWLFPSDSCS
ncbi:hypothetical protein GQ53DRAFT_718307 [Thozetella sp. PMI_491]|nr:hypothetical protein GQ53DRAFT_718307 [Thozetella sp. PMI_491]